jgi:formate dehydrogenase subunit gamma
MENNTDTFITAFSGLQRWFHKHIIHFMVVFIVTGLPVFSAKFSFLASIFSAPHDYLSVAGTGLSALGETTADRMAGGLQVARVLHRVTALFFLMTAIPFCLAMLATIRTWKLWPEESWSPLALARGLGELWKTYVRFEHGRFGKFNTGQKLFAWLMITAGVAITASGVVLIFRDLFSVSVQEQARFLHAASFVLMAMLLPVHIYLSLIPMNRHGLRAIFRDGQMSVASVRAHHPLWYEQLKREGRL